MPEQLPCLFEPPFAIASAYYYLHTYAEAQANHKNDHIIHTGKGRSTNLNLSYPTQECSISHSYQLLHDKTDKNRISYLPNLAIGVFSFHFIIHHHNHISKKMQR